MVARLRWLVLLVVVIGVGACGSDDDDTSTGDDGDRETTTSTTTTTVVEETTTTTAAAGGGGGDAVSGPISLTIDVTSDGVPVRNGTLSCGDTTSGMGFLADPAAAEAACALLRSNPTATSRLVDGRDEMQICTEIYGGPDVATVRGDLDGRPVDTTIDRTDGCGIADWDLLQPLIGPPGGPT